MGVKVLGPVLKVLSKWAIRKHGLKLIVVMGRHGTKLTSEFISELVSPDILLRKQLERPFWNYSVPLSLLGYEDRSYSLLEWFSLIVRATGQLLFGRRNFSWVALQMSTQHTEISSYWSDLIQPDILVLVNRDRRARTFEQKMIRRTKKYVVMYTSECKNMSSGKAKFIQVGSGKACDFRVDRWETDSQGTWVKGYWRNSSKAIEGVAFTGGEFMKEPLLLAIAVALSCDIEPSGLPERLAQMQIDTDRFLFTVPSI
jgi:hypothetical protein